MSTKHMNLKRISHRVKEEVSSTMEVAKVVGIKGAFASFRGKVDIQIMVHNGHIEHPWIRRHLLQSLMKMEFRKFTYQSRMKITKTVFGFVGGKVWKMRQISLKNVWSQFKFMQEIIKLLLSQMKIIRNLLHFRLG